MVLSGFRKTIIAPLILLGITIILWPGVALAGVLVDTGEARGLGSEEALTGALAYNIAEAGETDTESDTETESETETEFETEPEPDYNEPVPGDYVTEEKYWRGRVISVKDRDPEPMPSYFDDDDIMATRDIEQDAVVRVTSGPHRGEEVDIVNYYSDYDMYRIYMKEGMDVILVDFSGDLTDGVYLHDIARDYTIYFITGVFALLLILVGGVKGAKALATLAFICIYILKVMLPLIARGYSPVLVSTLSSVMLVVVTLLVIGGVNRKSLSAIIGTMFGLLLAGFLAHWTGNAAYLTGLSSQEAQSLYFMGQDINLRELLFAGIIIGALGAIIDVGISVASAAAEIKEARPSISRNELIIGAFNVGKDVMATMSNTMILAYVGAAIPLLLVILTAEMPWIRIINFEFIATEVVRGITISIGLVLSVPVTALAAGFLMGNKPKVRRRRARAGSPGL